MPGFLRVEATLAGAPAALAPVFENLVDSAQMPFPAGGATNVTHTHTGYAVPDPAGADQTLLVAVFLQDLQDWAQGNVSCAYAGTAMTLVEWSRSTASGASWSHAVWVFKLASPRAVAASGNVVATYAGPTEGACKIRSRMIAVRNWAGGHSGAQKVGVTAATAATLPATTTAVDGVRLFTAGAYRGDVTSPDPAPTGTGHANVGTPLDVECGGTTGVVATTSPGAYAPGWSWTGSSDFAGVGFIMTGTGEGDDTNGAGQPVPETAHGMRFTGAGSLTDVNNQTTKFTTRIGGGDASRTFTHYRADTSENGWNDWEWGSGSSWLGSLNAMAGWVGAAPTTRTVQFDWTMFPWDFVRAQSPNPGALDTSPSSTELADKQLAALTSAASGGMDTRWRTQRDNFLSYMTSNLTASAKPVRVIICLGIEHTGGWYPHGTGWDGGYAGRSSAHPQQFGLAFKRFVQIWMEDEANPAAPTNHRAVFAWCPTHPGFRDGSSAYGTWANWREWSWPGDGYADLVASTWYDTVWDSGNNTYDHGRNAGSTDSARDTWSETRWDLSMDSKWANYKSFVETHDVYGGLHEWGVFTEESPTPANNAAIIQANLTDSMGVDSPVFMNRMWDIIEDPAYRMLLPCYFSEIYKHDIFQYKSSDAAPHSDRHPRASAAFKTRWQALPTVGSAAAVVDWLIARRGSGFGA